MDRVFPEGHLLWGPADHMGQTGLSCNDGNPAKFPMCTSPAMLQCPSPNAPAFSCTPAEGGTEGEAAFPVVSPHGVGTFCQ